MRRTHIIKLHSCSDENFISPMVLTVKRDKIIQFALDSKILKKTIQKITSIRRLILKT